MDNETVRAEIMGTLAHIGTNRFLFVGGTPDTVGGAVFVTDGLLIGDETVSCRSCRYCVPVLR